MSGEAPTERDMRRRMFDWLRSVMGDAGLSHATKSVAWAISDLASANAVAWPGVASIAERVGSHTRTVEGCIRQLRDQGYIVVTDRRAHRQPSWYWLALEGATIGDQGRPPESSSTGPITRSSAPPRPSARRVDRAKDPVATDAQEGAEEASGGSESDHVEQGSDRANHPDCDKNARAIFHERPGDSLRPPAPPIRKISPIDLPRESGSVSAVTETDAPSQPSLARSKSHDSDANETSEPESRKAHAQEPSPDLGRLANTLLLKTREAYESRGRPTRRPGKRNLFAVEAEPIWAELARWLLAKARMERRGETLREAVAEVYRRVVEGFLDHSSRARSAGWPIEFLMQNPEEYFQASLLADPPEPSCDEVGAQP